MTLAATGPSTPSPSVADSLATAVFAYIPDGENPTRLRSTCGTILLRPSEEGAGLWVWELESLVVDKLVEGEDPSPLVEAKLEAESAAREVIAAMIRDQGAAPGALGAGVDVTGKGHHDLALRGLPRPTMVWDGAGYPLVARLPDDIRSELTVADTDDLARRFGRQRRMPVMYTSLYSGKATQKCSSGRLLECFHGHLCGCCGESLLDTVDGRGWILDSGDGWGTPGGPLCTNCAYMTVRLCPVFAAAHAAGQVTYHRADVPGTYYMHEYGGVLALPELEGSARSSYAKLEHALRVVRRPENRGPRRKSKKEDRRHG